jgi:hypothetical protein
MRLTLAEQLGPLVAAAPANQLSVIVPVFDDARGLAAVLGLCAIIFYRGLRLLLFSFPLGAVVRASERVHPGAHRRH